MEEATTTTEDDIDVAALGAWRPGAEGQHAVPPPLPDGDEAARPETAIAPLKPRKGARSALVWGSVGFMAGAVFWQVVGFGNLASNLVAEGTQDASATYALADAPTASSFPKPMDVPRVTTASETASLPAAPTSAPAVLPLPTAQQPAAEPEAAASAAAQPPAAAAPATPAVEPAASPALAADATPAPDPHAVYMVDPTNCTALELDRPTKRTLIRPCPDSGLPLRLEHTGAREDLAGLAANLVPARYSRD